MYRNLSPLALGISGRQSELIELALTYGFRSLDIDIDRYLKKAQGKGPEQAARFIASAQIKIGGFELPIKWRGDEAVYEQELERLDSMVALAAAAGARTALATVHPASDEQPYHENFELHRRRLDDIGAVLGKHKFRLGVGFLAAPAHRENKSYPFICDAEAMITLVNSVAAENVGLHLDTWNWHFGGGSVELLKSLGRDLVVAVSLADAPAGADAASITEGQRRLPVAGGGAVTNVELLRTLKEMGFSGAVTLRPASDCFKGMTREAIVQKCGSLMDELWKAAGIIKPKPSPALAES